jgi:micrococcal nuclease
MKHYFIISLLISIFITGCSQPGSQVTEDENEFVAQIVSHYPELKNKKYEVETIKRVVDGDTYDTSSDHRIRIIGVNTPEVFGEMQYYGREASDFSKKRLENQTVYLFRDVSDTDKYGRLLRYLFIQNVPVMFNETLLIEGYANTMTFPPDVMFAKKFLLLEREARENHKGLWGENKDSSSNPANCTNPQIKGNINSRNEKIYHLPDGRYYNQTKAEEMFCTEEEAVAAGFRKSKQ